MSILHITTELVSTPTKQPYRIDISRQTVVSRGQEKYN